MCIITYVRLRRSVSGLLSSRELTSPNSCITRSSWRRSSWPFSRNWYSWPLLPAHTHHTHSHRGLAVVFQLQVNTVCADLNFCSPWPGNHGYQSVCHTVKSSHHDDSTFHMFVHMYEVVREDCQARKLNKEDAMDRCKWRKIIKDVRWSGWVWVGECFFWYRPTRVVPDKRPLNGCVCDICQLIKK